MVTLLTIVHVIVCLVLILVVLLQSGKAADLAGAFGGMGSQTAFGPRGAATVLSKATTVSAVLFMLTSLTLAVLGTRSAGPGSVLEKTGKPAATETQKQPAPKPPAPASTQSQPQQSQPQQSPPQQQPATPPAGKK